EEEKQIQEDQAANARYWKIPAYYDDDDDYNFAITPNETVDSLIMGDEHLDTIPTMESDEFIKSSVENLVPNPSESEGENGCDMLACFTTFSNILFDAEYEFDSVTIITPNETVDSLIMGDEHLDTVPATESDEFIKSSVENLVPNPSESEGENGGDLPACFTTFSNILFDDEYEFDSADDQSLHNEDFPEEIFSNPLFEKEISSIKKNQHHFNAGSDLIRSMLNHDSSIIPSSSKIDSLLDEFAGELTLLKSEISSIKKNQHHFNAESDLVESMLNRDSSIISSSSKIDFLLDEFAGELPLLKSIPSGIDKTDYHPENEIHLSQRLLYDNSCPHPPKEFDLTFTPDDPMPPSIEEDDDDSRDTLIREKLLDNYSLSILENESFRFDVPLSSRPPAKPPD
nr:hypothetical protein [Tanacetum cinerariifolium]